ncbi:unnamed protein product [Mytilus coruscus]|uniref:Uncharacterized protein n=1 Tax=Mytilus coruscus TaxID=42192 RepID=A0A6J8CAR7_MYTCO|nr:unnamed protein product [Mytilus coruscus]
MQLTCCMNYQIAGNVVKGLPDFIPSSSSKNGICLKCNRTIEKIIKLEEELLHIRRDLSFKRQNVLKTQINIPSPRRATVTKRMLRSLVIPAEKQQRTELSTLIPIRLAQLQPFNELTKQPILKLDRQNQPEKDKPPEIMPKPKQTEGLSQQKTKISLQFTKEGLNSTDKDLTGEII